MATTTHLLLNDLWDVVKQSDFPVETWLSVYDLVEAAQTEAECVPALTPIHVVAKREDELEEATQAAAVVDLLGGLQHGCVADNTNF